MSQFIRVFTLIVLIPLFIFSLPFDVYSQSDYETLKSDIRMVYEEVLEAYEAGGNVSRAVDLLNEALELLEKYNFTGNEDYIVEARYLVGQVRDLIPVIRDTGESARFWGYVYLGVAISIIAFLAVLSYIYLPRVFFMGWLRLRGEYKVLVRRSRAKRKTVYLDEEVLAVIAAVVVIGGVFAFSQVYMAGRVVEPFSELGLLGRNMKIGDYPRDVVVGDNATFYVYVGNQMGRPMYYIVKVKLGDRETSIDPSPIEPVMVFERILLHNQSWIRRVDLPITNPGINQRIIVELWIYNESINDIQYDGRWTQIWFNATKP